jgi:hypothetical protein
MTFPFNILNNGAIQILNTGSFYAYFNYNLDQNSANMIVATNLSNAGVAFNTIGIVDLSVFTGVTIDNAETNLLRTELSGFNETRPKNIALLPVIRY